MAGELILIVEDNDKNLKLARDVLQYRGFRTLEAMTAADGIALAVEHQPDLVLMDIQLPDADGVSALQQLRAEAATRAIPVVAFTASVMEADRQRLDAAGFDGYLAKPIDVKAFPDQVERFCHSTAREGRGDRWVRLVVSSSSTTLRPTSNCSTRCSAPRATPWYRRRRAQKRWRWSTSRLPTSSCSTFSCRAWTATRSVAGCGTNRPPPICPSS